MSNEAEPPAPAPEAPPEGALPPVKKDAGTSSGCWEILGCMGCFVEALAIFSMLLFAVGAGYQFLSGS